ncbi:hypothetical protein B0H11DRAFT_2199945 [Mycena galericulata]|nr:hypothetical protein B0H11DRAFT_2199945 [Mycena galericulata]
MGDSNIDTTVGPLLIGVIFNTYLYGLVTSQYLSYWNLKFNDPTWIKVVVGILFLMDTGQSIIAFYEAWNVWYKKLSMNCNKTESFESVTHFGTAMFADWTRPFTGIATSFSALVTQAFLSHRVFKLTKSKPLTAALAVLIIAAFVFGFTSGIRGYFVNGSTDVKPILSLVICKDPSFFAFFLVNDWMLTRLAEYCVLIFVLSRSKTGFRRTDKIINSLIRGAIQSGLLVTMFTLGDLLCFTLSSKTNLYTMFVYPLGRVYTNTVLYTLNARMSFFQMDQNNDTGGMVTGLSYSIQLQTEFPGPSERSPMATGTGQLQIWTPGCRKMVRDGDMTHLGVGTPETHSRIHNRAPRMTCGSRKSVFQFWSSENWGKDSNRPPHF